MGTWTELVLLHMRGRLGERGQGTVEYVALIMLVAVVLAGVVAATKGVGDGGIGAAVVKQLKSAIERTAGS